VYSNGATSLNPGLDSVLLVVNLNISFLLKLNLKLADGKIDSNELNTIFSIAQKIGISKEEFDRVVKNNESIKNKFPVAFKDKRTQLCHLIAMMFVDGQIDNNEFIFEINAPANLKK
jgi:hypothetical protein